MAPGWAFNRDGSNSLSSVGCGNKSLVPFSIAFPLWVSIGYSLMTCAHLKDRSTVVYPPTHRTLKLLYNPERSTTMAGLHGHWPSRPWAYRHSLHLGLGDCGDLQCICLLNGQSRAGCSKRVWLAFLECRVVEANSKYLCDAGAVKCTGFTLCG